MICNCDGKYKIIYREEGTNRNWLNDYGEYKSPSWLILAGVRKRKREPPRPEGTKMRKDVKNGRDKCTFVFIVPSSLCG
jgi:hypothetical protein